MKKVLFIFICLISFIACNDDKDSNDSQNSSKLGFLDIQDATYLYIQENATKSVGSSTLFKITEEGIVKEVTYKNKLGEEYKTTLVPTQIINVSKDYVVLNFTNEYYLVNKHDGSAYLLPLDHNSGYSTIVSDIKTDFSGRLYLIINNNYEGQNTLYRLNTTNPQNITLETLTPSHHQPVDFLIDINNNLYYKEGQIEGNEKFYVQNNHTTAKLDIKAFWLGMDGYCYVSSWKALNDSEKDIQEAEFIYKATFINSKIEFKFFDANTDYKNAIEAKDIYQIGKQLYLIHFFYDYQPKCIVFNITNEESLGSTLYSCPESFASIKKQDDKYIYSTPKEGDFYRFNPVNGELKKIYTHDTDYEIYGDIKISQGTVIFTAFQLSSGKNVMVELTDGNMKTTDLGSANKCVVLEKIQ